MRSGWKATRGSYASERVTRTAAAGSAAAGPAKPWSRTGKFGSRNEGHHRGSVQQAVQHFDGALLGLLRRTLGELDIAAVNRVGHVIGQRVPAAAVVGHVDGLVVVVTDHADGDAVDAVRALNATKRVAVGEG